MSSTDCFSRTGLWNTQQKAVRLYFVFVEILYHERLFIVNKGIDGLKADQGTECKKMLGWPKTADEASN